MPDSERVILYGYIDVDHADPRGLEIWWIDKSFGDLQTFLVDNPSAPVRVVMEVVKDVPWSEKTLHKCAGCRHSQKTCNIFPQYTPAAMEAQLGFRHCCFKEVPE